MSSLPPRIGRYEVLGNLAFGGMAEILLGRLSGPSGFERIVVIKRILPHLQQRRGFVEMFLDEARTVARIHHPNVVQVHELGDAGGELFLVMEYLEGESVAGLMRRLLVRGEALDPAIAAHIAAEACRGLHTAHELRDLDGAPLELIHRDVSPQNLFVTYGGVVKLLDFGVARVADRQALTEAGQVKGKSAYMSPEQCRGRTLDRRSDLFSMGAVLFEMLTGTALFRRETDHATYKAICEETAPHPSQIRPGVPARLERVIARALLHHRGERYESAAAMRSELLDAIDTARREQPVDTTRVANLDQALEALMRRVFSDRIEDKAEMLRRARTGSVLLEVPPAEVDENVDIPTAEPHPGVRNADESALKSVSYVGPEPTPSKRRTRSAWTWVASIAVAAATAGVVVMATRSSGTPEPVSAVPSGSTPVAEAAAQPELAPSAPGTAPAPTMVRLRLETTPPGARVTIDGSDRGETPADIELPRSGDPVMVELRRAGFEPRSERVVPATDRRIVLPLRATAAGAPARAPVKPSVQPTAAAAPPATIEKLP